MGTARVAQKRYGKSDNFDVDKDDFFTNRRLSPKHLLVYDVVVQPNSSESASASAILEVQERLPSSLQDALKRREWLADNIDPERMTSNREEQARIRNLVHNYGWMQALRLEESVPDTTEDVAQTQCRWIHVASKFTEYIEGMFLALSNHENNSVRVMTGFRQLRDCIQQNERFSKHGRYFIPFHHSSDDPSTIVQYPLLLSVPFIDWGLDGPPPPLRFQVDPREAYASSRSSSHLLRSILKHYYKLEDTDDREHKQVFNRHKPWHIDRELDLKVRRWYGHYPTALLVDEMWVLVIDEKHLVTFSSNQTWKSRWPPLQLSSRIEEVSFRAIRTALLSMDRGHEYRSLTHVIACLSGALGMLHRSFWTDMPLCLTDRFAGYLSHLQYRLYRAPSTKLVMDLLQVQEELNIVIQVTQQQMTVVEGIHEDWYHHGQAIGRPQNNEHIKDRPRSEYSTTSSLLTCEQSAMHILSVPPCPTIPNALVRGSADPMSQLTENLRRELSDLLDLRENTNNLVNRTIQLVNIRLEDHGKAILVFTMVTVVFMPLSFVASFFGMNVSDIRTLDRGQWLFWAVASCTTVGVVAFSIFFAFYGNHIYARVTNWRAERHRATRLQADTASVLPRVGRDDKKFRVFSASRSDKWS